MTQQVNTLFVNALVLTMDENFSQYSPGAVAVNGDSIVAVGREEELKNEFAGQETIDCNGKVLMPGLINAHTHLEFSELTSPLGEPGMPLAEWIPRVIKYRRERGTAHALDAAGELAHDLRDVMDGGAQPLVPHDGDGECDGDEERNSEQEAALSNNVSFIPLALRRSHGKGCASPAGSHES